MRNEKGGRRRNEIPRFSNRERLNLLFVYHSTLSHSLSVRGGSRRRSRSFSRSDGFSMRIPIDRYESIIVRHFRTNSIRPPESRVPQRSSLRGPRLATDVTSDLFRSKATRRPRCYRIDKTTGNRKCYISGRRWNRDIEIVKNQSFNDDEQRDNINFTTTFRIISAWLIVSSIPSQLAGWSYAHRCINSPDEAWFN